MLRLILAFTLLASSALHASKEGALAISEYSLRSNGIGSSGAIEVSGAQSQDGITSLKVAFLGKTFIAKPQDLACLKGFSFNGLLLSYEHGYKEVGGRTVYMTFVFGFTSGNRKSVTLSLSEFSGFKRIPE